MILSHRPWTRCPLVFEDADVAATVAAQIRDEGRGAIEVELASPDPLGQVSFWYIDRRRRGNPLPVVDMMVALVYVHVLRRAQDRRLERQAPHRPPRSVYRRMLAVRGERFRSSEG